jgi:enamine deaminase RidA (YjgF/YER057c/UK114 family)
MKEYFKYHKPALTIAVVKGLAYQEYLLEVEAIAIKEE